MLWKLTCSNFAAIFISSQPLTGAGPARFLRCMKTTQAQHKPTLRTSQQSVGDNKAYWTDLFWCSTEKLAVLVRNRKAFNQTTSATPIFHAAWPGTRIISLSCCLRLVNAPPRPSGLMMWPQCARQQLLLKLFIYLFGHQRYLCLAQTLLLALSLGVPALLFTSAPLLRCLCTVQHSALSCKEKWVQGLQVRVAQNFFTPWSPKQLELLTRGPFSSASTPIIQKTSTCRRFFSCG